jgi:hypothetical protein
MDKKAGRGPNSAYQLGTPKGLVNFYHSQLNMMRRKGLGGTTSCGNKITETMVRMTIERLKELSIKYRFSKTSLDDVGMLHEFQMEGTK